MKAKDSKQGLIISYKSDIDVWEGYVNFISKDYITVCLHEWETPHTLHGYSQCNLLVYPDYYKHCSSNEAYHNRVISTAINKDRIE